MKHMPETLPKNRFPDRHYFFTVFNTINEPYVQELIRYATEQRNSASRFDMQQETIEIGPTMEKMLNSLPFVSGKIFAAPDLM